MASLDPLRVLEHVHGHLGWLVAIALAHPAVLLRRPGRRAHLSVALAVGLVTVVGAVGVALYGPYRETLRGPIHVTAPALGFLFEDKEVFAFAAILFAWAGAVAYAAGRSGGTAAGGARKTKGVGGDVRTGSQRAAHWAFVASALFALVAAVLGTVVASHKTF